MTPLVAGLPILNAAMLIASGILVVVVSDKWLSPWLIPGFALVIGLVHGFFNGAALAEANSSGLAVGGIVCAAFLIVALVAGQVVSLQKEWARTAVRVAGSWIGAIGLLMLGWAAR
jgi:hypothetical protein